MIIDELKALWLRWADEADEDQDAARNRGSGVPQFNGNILRASTKRLCMEDIERLLERHGEELPEREHNA